MCWCLVLEGEDGGRAGVGFIRLVDEALRDAIRKYHGRGKEYAREDERRMTAQLHLDGTQSEVQGDRANVCGNLPKRCRGHAGVGSGCMCLRNLDR